jgi:hypothetical protein
MVAGPTDRLLPISVSYCEVSRGRGSGADLATNGAENSAI